jgi:hypothetical protein
MMCRKRTTGLYGSGLTKDNIALKMMISMYRKSTTSRTLAVAASRFPRIYTIVIRQRDVENSGKNVFTETKIAENLNVVNGNEKCQTPFENYPFQPNRKRLILTHIKCNSLDK